MLPFCYEIHSRIIRDYNVEARGTEVFREQPYGVVDRHGTRLISYKRLVDVKPKSLSYPGQSTAHSSDLPSTVMAVSC